MKEVAGIIFPQAIRFAGFWDALPVKSAWHRRTEENYNVRAAGRLASMIPARGGEVKMAEYIDREKAIEAFTFADADVCQEYGDYDCEFGFSRENIKVVLESVQAADVVSVVRCRECNKSSYDDLYGKRWCNRTLSCVQVKDNDFCNYGKRK